MSTISIREQQKTETGFRAILSFDGGTEYSIEVCDPFSAEQEAELGWYFERWLVFPLLSPVRAEQARESVRVYGESLFEQVFRRDADAYSDYKAMRDSLTQIEIIGNSTEFQALHWEALHDPQMPRSLAVDCSMVRKRVKAIAGNANIAPSSVIRLLVVTARPGEENDVNHRTISRPLMELIQQSQLRVQVDLLRPATFEALSEHLEEKGAGFYHIVHLDMHGAVVSFEQLESMPHDRFTFRFGEPLESFEGMQAFLSFESGTPGKSDLRSASELAKLLTGKQIPVCILNACQSAKQVRGDERETSLGAALMAAGMQTVLAMGYSVTVSAAEILMRSLYEKLFAGKELDEAIRLGRKALWDRKERRAYFNQTIRLEDWLLPVVYRRGRVDLKLRPFTPQEEEAYWQQQAALYRFEAPTYGFVGRDLEILKIERSLLRHNVLLVQGMGGTGKTTLLNYLREWWQTTRFVKDVFYFGYDQKAHTLEQILFAIAHRVYDPYEAAQFQVMPLAAQVTKLVKTLKANPYALMLDNLESVTGQPLAIQNTLNSEEQEKLRDFLQRLVGGKTKVVLGSRGREQWLNGVLNGAVYKLRGLDQESRTALAEKILARQVQDNRKIGGIRQSEDFQKLMKLLAGYPLAMEVVLGNLRRQSAAEILAGLDAADVNLDSNTGDKTASILKCVDYSYNHLSSDAQRSLLCLAPFSSFLDRQALSLYLRELQKIDFFSSSKFEELEQAINTSVDWGLFSPINTDDVPTVIKPESENRLLTVHPLLPFFLRTKLKELDCKLYEEIKYAFSNFYQEMASFYEKVMSDRNLPWREAGLFLCGLEYENIFEALKISLNLDTGVQGFFCLNKYLELKNDFITGVKLGDYVYSRFINQPQHIQAYSFDFAKVSHAFSVSLSERGEYERAKEVLSKVLETLGSSTEIDAKIKQNLFARTCHQFGVVSHKMNDLEGAEIYYKRALSCYEMLDEPSCVACICCNLAAVSQDSQDPYRFQKAQHLYDKALRICVKLNDIESQAPIYYGLSRMHMVLRKFDNAKNDAQEVLDISSKIRDLGGKGRAYLLLAKATQGLNDYAGAISEYQNALSIFIELNDCYQQAIIYCNLGVLEEEQKNWAEAKAYFQKALPIFEQMGQEQQKQEVMNALERISSNFD